MFSIQKSSPEANCRDPGLCELAGPFDCTNPGGGLFDQPLVSDGLPVAPDSIHNFNGRGSAVASAHRKNPLAQEAGAGFRGPSELAWWVGQIDFKDINLFELCCVEKPQHQA